MSYELRDHTADVAVAADGDSLGETVAAVADGLAAAMCDAVPDGGGERFELSVTATGREAALYDYLDRLIYERDVRGVLPVDNEATVTAERVDGASGAETGGEESGAGDDRAGVTIRASARGVPLSAVVARDVKAVTYSEMRVESVAGGWEAYVVFDV
ncbi:MAG: archease [Halolamina sp.]